MAKAIFITPHTLSFAAGVVLVATLMFVLPFDRRGQQDDVALWLVAGLVIFFAFFESALFSLGCAWGGVVRLPKPVWAFVAGIFTAAGYILFQVLLGSLPAPADIESHKSRGIYVMLGTVFVFIAPIVFGFICGWLWKRRRLQ